MYVMTERPKDKNECWQRKRKWGPGPLYLYWEKFIQTFQCHPQARWLANSSKKNDKLGFFFFLRFKVFHPRFYFTQPRLWKKLRGSRNENRKKLNTTVWTPFWRSWNFKKRTLGFLQEIKMSKLVWVINKYILKNVCPMLTNPDTG